MSEKDFPAPEQESKPHTLSRRRFLQASAGGVALALGLESIQPQDAAANANVLITKENVGQFRLQDIAKQKGKLISFSVSGEDLSSSLANTQVVEGEAGRIEDDSDFLWIKPDGSGLRPTKDVKDMQWDGIDKTISVAEAHNLSYAAQSLIFGDTGEGDSTTRIQRVPDWLINGNYNYDQSIQIGKDSITAVITHLKDQGVFNPTKPDANKQLRLGVLNELLNDSVALYNKSQANGGNLDNPSIWFKDANYWQQQAITAGDSSPIPQYIKEFLIAAREAAGDEVSLGISDYNIETWNDFNGDPTGSTPNQKAQVMYSFIKALKADPDLKDVMKSFYVGVQGHLDAKQVLDAGTDKYSASVAKAVEMYKSLGVDVKWTETTVAQDNLSGSQDQNDQDAAKVWGTVPVKALEAGASELTVFKVSDWDSDKQDSLFDATYAPKAEYTALALGLVSLPNAT